MNVIPDTLDLSAYMGHNEVAAKVRNASDYAALLSDSFAPRKDARKPEMFSTKLRGVIEFRPGELTCWAGYNGHRKSTFTGQVALDLITQRQRTLIASFEMKPVDTLNRMARQIVGAERPTQIELDRFTAITDGRLWMFDHVGRVTPDHCLALIRYFADKLKGQHVFIDSLMMVCASEDHLDEQKQLITDLVRVAQETDVHIHLIAHCRKPQTGEERPPSKYDIRGSAAISDQAHNVVTVWLNKPKKAGMEAGELVKFANEPDALVTVEKQRNGRWEGRVKLWFDEPSMRFRDEAHVHLQPYAEMGGR